MTEWRLIRRLRLEALADSPSAFGSSHRREAALSDDEWVAFVSPLAWFIVESAGRPVGLVAGRAQKPEGTCEVLSLWVEPASRGDGSAAALMEAVSDWARQEGATTATLWVSDGNDRARRFYERLGYVPTGHRQPLASDPSVLTAELSAPL